MPSIQFQELKKNVNELRRHLLPSRFDETGAYRERVYTHVLAFRLLCHAAIEDYLETRVIEIATQAASHCKKHKTISEPAAHLASFSEKRYGPPPETFTTHQKTKEWGEEVDLVERVTKASGVFVKHIKNDNHGIREKHLTRMLLSVGLRKDKIDPLLISELDNFGDERGKVAHSSSRKHVKTNPNPKDEYIKVIEILGMLKPLDDELNKILKSAIK